MNVVKKISRCVWLAVVVLTFASCSTQKNTFASRSFHQTKVKYNIFYNGNIAYEEGLKAIDQANEDDYSAIINLYPVSNHTAAESSASQMERTIEKCRKCIKLHSIKSKPKVDPKKKSDPKYKQWLQSEEFNNQMGNAWIRLGEAEFHKGDFLGSIGTFSYVVRHFQNDPDMVARCNLWIARAYAEMGWQYEAEDVLSKVQVDALSRKHAPLYSAVSADVLMKAGRYHEAIPFVKIALPAEKRKMYRPRFQYVLAQLYERENNRALAVDAYSKVIRMAPSPEMDFSARLHKAQLEGKSAIRGLLKMTNQSKNKDKLDQIYGAIGAIYLAEHDTIKALENFCLAIEKSSMGGMPKASVLVKAGDLYFDRCDYVLAQPCYREASTILPVDHADYERIQLRSEVLDELVVEYTTVQLQDSLQHLSQLTEEEQKAVVDKIIADLIAAEKEAEEQAALAAREAADAGTPSVDTRNMIGGGAQAGEWYFYNAQLMKSGRQDFVRKWGNRPLEDNWRRLSKSMSTMATESLEQDEEVDEEQKVVTDSMQMVAPPATDPHQPEYYLRQIPKTAEDIAASDSAIASALYNMVYIYQDKLHDQSLADETMSELVRRYPKYAGLLDLYYMKYLSAIKNEDVVEQERYRVLIQSAYPDSKQAYIVSQPDYFGRLRQMAVEQDSLYEDTYKAYMQGNFAQVMANKSYAETTYPLSPLMPRFLFLNAVSVARSQGQQAFVSELKDLVERYPGSELAAMGKSMLAMMGEGLESQTGAATSSLADMRSKSSEAEDEDEQTSGRQLSDNRKESSVVLIVLPGAGDEKDLNQMLYQVALFNFSQFMIRDFDIQKMPVFGSSGGALRISGFDSLDEAVWYVGIVDENAEFREVVRQMDARLIPITESNLPLLNTAVSIEEYEQFLGEQKK